MPRTALEELLTRTGMIADVDAATTQALLARIDQVREEGVDDDALRTLVQAYGRAIGRVAAAEAQVALRHLAHLPEDEREEGLRRWIEHVMPVGSLAFSQLHPPLVERLVRRNLTTVADDSDPDADPASVAFVDLCGSTAYMLRATPDEIRDLADEVYMVGQEMAVGRDVVAGKFLGDGVLLVGRDRAALLGATLDTLGELGRRTPLRASGGVAHGWVLRRAGDYFGPTVNLAARLSEAASADAVLVDPGALPDHPHRAHRVTVQLRGASEPREAAVIEAGGEA
ncbi:MAG TPA: hypothetical protein VD931_11405 [Baekduia sp.]|nr:hypothetical protein [Baekduia sp.]